MPRAEKHLRKRFRKKKEQARRVSLQHAGREIKPLQLLCTVCTVIFTPEVPETQQSMFIGSGVAFSYLLPPFMTHHSEHVKQREGFFLGGWRGGTAIVSVEQAQALK